MCGIVGYLGRKQAANVLIDGLYRLEYRGYDSVGIALLDGKKFKIIKKTGRVKEIESARGERGTVGIGHTRWATHGDVTVENAHPHSYKNIALVHNGIVENAVKLKRECVERGETFNSETDSEVIAHLIADAYAGDLEDAVIRACGKLVGSYALAVLCCDEPETIVCARMHSPLIDIANKRFASVDHFSVAYSNFPLIINFFNIEHYRFYVMIGGFYSRVFFDCR